MNNQQILDNAPEGATHIDDEHDFCKEGYYFSHTSQRWMTSEYIVGSRSLADIRRIAELEEELKETREICDAVAHVGVDFGYGVYVLEDSVIHRARLILEALKEQGNG